MPPETRHWHALRTKTQVFIDDQLSDGKASCTMLGRSLVEVRIHQLLGRPLDSHGTFREVSEIPVVTHDAEGANRQAKSFNQYVVVSKCFGYLRRSYDGAAARPKPTTVEEPQWPGHHWGICHLFDADFSLKKGFFGLIVPLWWFLAAIWASVIFPSS
ncbi:MAG: hypothetical protein CM1200mP27_07500 [Chloroflexota bacterium]|nr:MAG: hypothetical protein CM1200mP27_07500 [Chloroflexota bacterium]